MLQPTADHWSYSTLISESTNKIIVCSLVTSCLDHDNALIHCACASSLSRLQRTQLLGLKHNISASQVTLAFNHAANLIKADSTYFQSLTSPLYIQELVRVYRPNRSMRSESFIFLVQSCSLSS